MSTPKTRKAGTHLHGVIDGVRGLQRGDEPLGARQQLEGLERLHVRDGRVLRPPAVLEPRVLGPDPRVVQTGGNGVRFRDLAVLVLRGGEGVGIGKRVGGCDNKK